MKKSWKWMLIPVGILVCLFWHGTLCTAGNSHRISGEKQSFKISKKIWKKKLKDNRGKVYMTFEYQYPTVSGTGNVAKQVAAFYRRAREKWYAADKENREDAKGVWKQSKKSVQCSDIVSCSITYQGSDYISVLQEGYLYMGGAHGLPYRMASVFSAKTGKPVTAMTLMKKEKKQVNKEVRKNYKKRFKKNPGEFFDEKRVLEGLKCDFAGKGMFYLAYDKSGNGSGKVIRFYADVYQLAPYAGGYVETTPMAVAD